MPGCSGFHFLHLAGGFRLAYDFLKSGTTCRSHSRKHSPFHERQSTSITHRHDILPLPVLPS